MRSPRQAFSGLKKMFDPFFSRRIIGATLRRVRVMNILLRDNHNVQCHSRSGNEVDRRMRLMMKMDESETK